ncbi:ATP-binding protein [Streptomyces sp. NPDC058855]|uniref:ATP-binding protein n=1 Tax=Streptomyces sp. NPDC058855 TaxID=3346651 RepID=UPI00369CB76E
MGLANVPRAGHGYEVRTTDHPGGSSPGLVGREAETAALRAALAAHRLVTVTGAAGVGKSRLALAAVAVPEAGPRPAVIRVRWHDGVPAGPWAFAARIARALDAATEVPGRTASPDLATAVRSVIGGELLLVLDDVDPVHADCTRLAQSLLMSLPDLRVLVTARRPLGLGAEHVLRLGPLPTDPPAAGLSPAAALFHARALRHGRIAPGDRHAVDRVCALVEGVPLALELAAAQLEHTSVNGLVARLAHGQCWLTAPGPGTAVQRHRSVRASLGAVHTLCAPAVRAVWRGLSVFAGSFTEQAASFVCESTGLTAEDVPRALAELTANGVLDRQGEHGAVCEPRYQLARAARDFGTERLAAAGEAPALEERHARHCRSVAAVAETLWNTGLQQQAVRLVHDELPDLEDLLGRAAHRPDRADIALETALHLWFWWVTRQRARDGAGHLLALLPLLPADSHQAARGQWLAGWLTAGADPVTARALLDRAWTTAVLTGDDALVGRVAHAHGTLAWRRGDLLAAAGHYRHAADTVPDHAPGGPTRMVSLAALAVVQSHFAPARASRTARRALAQPSACHDTWAVALAQYARALTDHRSGRTARARHRARRALSQLAARLDAPQAHSALSRLLDHLESGSSPFPPGRPRLPGPRAEPRTPTGRPAR